MRRVWRNGSRVLSAILAAAMIFTSLPVSGITAYAEEATPQAVVTETVHLAEVAGTVAAEETPAEGEPPADGKEPFGTETPAVGDGENGDAEGPSGGEAPADGEEPSNGETSADGEEPTEDSNVSLDATSTEEQTAEIVEDEIATASDDDATPESDFTWDGTTITAYNGSDTHVVIPNRANAIGSSAFYRSDIESVRFNAGTTEIGDNAFAYCTRLKSVDLPLQLETIDWNAFYSCGQLEEIQFPSSLKSIGGGAFEFCNSLQEVYLPDSVETIGSKAFRQCKSLTSIRISAGVTSIGSEAFNGGATRLEYGEGTTTVLRTYATKITEVVIPDSVTRIDTLAFNGCTSLKSVTMPENLQTIGSSAFTGCTALKEIVWSDALQEIGGSAFRGCTSLTTLDLPEGLEILGSSTFSGCTSLASLALPQTLQQLGESTFSGCTSLTSVVIPASVTKTGTYIENTPFKGCTSLDRITYAEGTSTILPMGAQYASEVVIPSTATSIYQNAFKGYVNLESIRIPDSVQTISYGAFVGCTSLTSAYVSGGLVTGYYDIFNGCTSLQTLEFGEGITTVPQLGATAVRIVVLPSTVVTIARNAFDGCTNLISINLPTSLRTIDSQAFQDCTSLASIDLPEGLQTINNNAFKNCTSLSSVTLPSSLKEMDNAFNGCTGLTQVRIPANVESARYAFANCTGLTQAYIAANESGNYYAMFEGCTSLQYLEYEEGFVTIPRVYAQSATTVVLPSTARTISDCAFQNYSSLTEINLPQGITSIESNAFSGCTSLTEINLPEGITSIGYAAFYGCTGLTRMVIPGNVTELESLILNKCTSLDYLEFGEGITTIPATGASNVSTVVLPSTVRTIEEYAFAEWDNLTTINLPASLKTIGYHAFYHNPDWQITALRFEGDGDVTIDSGAFYSSGDVTRVVPVYCTTGSKVYDYFNGREGFRVIAANSIKYVLNGGTNAPGNPGSYETGEDLTFLDPTRPGYTFQGWYTDSKFTTRFVYDKNKTNGNLTLYAKWTEITYSITYDLNGGSLPKGKTNPTTYVVSKDVTLVAPARAGAAFAGWLVNGTDTVITNGKIAANTYAQDLTLIAQWREYSYQLIWNKNAKDAAGTMDPVTLAVSQAYTIPEEGYTRAGYDFLGWNTAANGKGKSYVEGDVVQGLATKEGAKVTLYAQWQKSIYEIVYVMNDSETSPAVNHKSNPDSYSVAQKVKLQNPTRTGYLFDGWYTDADLATKVTTVTSAMGDVTVYAKWTPITYTITFNKNKGTGTMGALTATYDQTAVLTANAFVRSGYTFLGWDTAANSKAAEPAYTDGQEVNNLSSKNKAKVTLYAKWQINQIPIKYVLNDTEEDPATNSAKNPDYVTIEKNVVLAAPTRAGYKFGGWFTDEALTQALAKNTIAKTMTDPVTVYAYWIENSYTLKLDKNGGTYTIPTEVDGKLVVGKHEYEDEITLPDGTGASRTNYEFTGWNTKKDRTGTHYEPGQQVSGLAAKGTVTLYAEWTPIADKTYSITYHGIDESWDNSKNPSVYSFEKDIKLANPTKTGYTFKGWYAEDLETNPKAKKVTTISKKTTGDVEVYGAWTENTYTIAYNGNKGSLPKGVKMNAQTALYSEDVDLTTNAFTRKGYEFAGWNTKANGTGDAYADAAQVSRLMDKNKGKVTLYAQWQAIEYTITYEGAEDGTEGVENTNPMTYTIEKDVKLVNPTAYGYTFKGWYNDDPETNAKAGKVSKIAKATADNVTVYAQWSENKYNLRFSTNSLFGSSVKSVTNRLYTEEFNIPATEPTKEGCTFQGWALTRDGEAIFRAGDPVTFADIHEAGGTAKGLVGTKYFTLYAIFAEE